MKLKNILSVLSFLFVAASCSMESDTLMNDTNKEMEMASEKYASLSLTVGMGDMQTKASTAEDETANDDEARINNVIFFLLDEAGNVFNYAIGDESKVLTKVKQGLSVMAIANATDGTKIALLACSTKVAIEAVSLTADDLAAFVKVGSASVDFKDFTGSSSTAGADEKSISIKVKQVAARIDLSELSFTYAAGERKYPVKLVSVSLNNRNTAGLLSCVAAAGGYDFTNENKNGEFTDASSTFYSFANNDANNKTALKLTFEVNGKSIDKVYTIKTPDKDEIVNSGYLYKLNVRAVISSGMVDCSVSCTVKDWVYNSVSVDMTENK